MKGFISKSPPFAVWIAALFVIVLRGVPFMRIWANANGSTPLLPASYLPVDWLQYVALIRQPHNGGLFLADPFTTDPQGERFLLLFHKLLNYTYHATAIDPFWLLELSRIPLVFIFFCIYWLFVRDVFPSNRERIWAIWLVALSGGIDYIVRLTAEWLPPSLAEIAASQLSPLNGWSRFSAFWNPLWISGFTLLLLILRPAMRPGGPNHWYEYLVISVGFIMLWFTHAYSGIAAMAAMCGAWVYAWAADGRFERRTILRVFLVLIPSFVLQKLSIIFSDRNMVIEPCGPWTILRLRGIQG